MSSVLNTLNQPSNPKLITQGQQAKLRQHTRHLEIWKFGVLLTTISKLSREINLKNLKENLRKPRTELSFSQQMFESRTFTHHFLRPKIRKCTGCFAYPSCWQV
jgi:hypothetical protein